MNSRAEKILIAIASQAKIDFYEFKQNGLLGGEFEDKIWQYKGRNILFTEADPERSRLGESHSPLPATAGMIARSFAMKEILSKPSVELIYGRMMAFRELAWALKQENIEWPDLGQTTLNNCLNSIKANNKIATTYHRATCLSSFVDYANQMSSMIDGVDERYMNRFLRWKHGIPNPIRSALEITSEEHGRREKNLYTPDLHLGLSEARAIVANNPSLEPSPGYDLIRLEAMAFGMALGLRIGEICSLPRFCLDIVSNIPFVRVPTLKSHLPAATPVADIWLPPLKQAYDYLAAECADARNRALDIETNGFNFVTDILSNWRKEHPLSETEKLQLDIFNLDPDTHFFISEIVSNLSVSKKEMVSDGQFSSCLRDLPRLVGARVASWLDERFIKWDWHEYKKTKYFRGHHLSSDEIAKLSGVSKASMKKAKWFVNELRQLMTEMQDDGVFEPTGEIEDKLRTIKIIKWRTRWENFRDMILERRGGGAGVACTVVDIDAFKKILEAKYASYLKNHFKEQFEPNPDSDTSDFIAKNQKPGHTTKLSENLIVLWENQFNSHTSWGIIPRPIFRSDFYNYLSKSSYKKTIFERLDLKDDEGNIFSFSPHHVRRWVTTAVLRSGPSETAVDLWMGRKPRQSRHYDYRTATERAEHVREAYMTSQPPEDFLGKKVVEWRKEGLHDQEIEQLVIEKLKVLNFSPWGGCSRELYLTPCTKGLVCVRGFGTEKACASFHLDTNDLESRQHIEELRDRYRTMLSAVTGNYEAISISIAEELSDTEPLDQHIQFIAEVLQGCEAALKLFHQGSKEDDCV